MSHIIVQLWCLEPHDRIYARSCTNPPAWLPKTWTQTPGTLIELHA